MRLAGDEIMETFKHILHKNQFNEIQTELIAYIFTNNSIDGIYSHGLNRFARFIYDVKNKYVIPNKIPKLKHHFNGLEQWDGCIGPGPSNAWSSTERAIQLAKEFGIGCVALSNSNHWMRGGTYGRLAAENDYIFMAWTNTIANMPAWNATDPKLGNNPIVFAAPNGKKPIVLDMAMSQYSFGKIKNYYRDGQKLPYDGGFDENGEFTSDPKEILDSNRPLPIGLWKGAGMSLLLDILSTILSGGLSTANITKLGHEHSCSQVFIAINTNALSNSASIQNAVENIISEYKKSVPQDGKTVLFPGERCMKTRTENIKKGVPVNECIWEEILKLK